MEAPKITFIKDTKTRKENGPNVIIPNTQTGIVKKALTNDTFFSKGIKIEDIDVSVIDCFDNYFDFNEEGSKIPVHALSMQKENEVDVVKQSLLEDNDYDYPLFFLTKDNVPQVGTNFQQYNIASEELFLLKTVKTVAQDGKNQIDKYYIPQPIKIDVTYYLDFIGETLKQVNNISEKIISEFAAREVYVSPQGCFMPLVLESIEDQTEFDIEKRRFYSQKFKIKCLGYILNRENFRIITHPEKINIDFSFKNNDTRNCTVTTTTSENGCIYLLFPFNRKNKTNTYIIEESVIFTKSNMTDLTSFEILINDQLSTLPVMLNKNDIITINYIGESDKSFIFKLFN